MKGMYDPLKLSERMHLFADMRACIIGAGAVGTYVAEFLTKLGVKYITLLDFDEFTLQNAAKHSCLIRTPEDVDKNKALATAARIAPLMIEGGAANGISGSVTQFGPMAFAGYDVVFLAVDNYAAKIYFNEQWLQIPVSDRPLVVMGGTNGETEMSTALDGSGPCLRCLMDEDWLEDGTVRTSCTGPQLRVAEGVAKTVRTSNLASAGAAMKMVKDFRSYVWGDDRVRNRRSTYSPAMDTPDSANRPLPRKTCPDCGSFAPADKLLPLQGDVTALTLGEALDQMAAALGTTDFYLETHTFIYDRIAQNALILTEYCRHCGKPLGAVNRHEGRTFPEDLLCDNCKAAGKAPVDDPARPTGKLLRSLRMGQVPEELLSMPLYDLGWPVGACLCAVQKKAKATFLDDDYMTCTAFTCSGDAALMRKNLIADRKEIVIL